LKKKINAQRLVSCLLVLCLLCSLIPSSIKAAANPAITSESGIKTDLAGHWSQLVMEKWVQLGLLSGDSSGQYAPNRAITRSEFVALIDRLFHFPADVNPDQLFSDVRADAWYSGALMRAYHAGIIKGVSVNKFSPQAFITREDATVIVARAFQLKGNDEGKSAFADSPDIAAYAQLAVQLMQKKGYVKGGGEGLFKPKASITRAETVQMIDNVTGTLVRENEVLREHANGNVTIQGGGTTLSNLVVAGDLYITQGAANGEVSLIGVTVKGNIYVFGGGRLSLLNTTISGSIQVNNPSADMEIIASGSSTIPTLELWTGATLKEQQLATGYEGFDKVIVAEGARSGLKLVITENTTIARLTLETAAEVTIHGEILIADLLMSGSTLSKWPKKVHFGTGVTATIEGKLVTQEREVMNTTGGGSFPGTNPGPGPGTEPEPGSNGPLPVVEDNLAKASVIVSAAADLQTRQAADKLIRYVEQSTGVKLPLTVDYSTAEKLIASNGSLLYEPSSPLEAAPTVADFKVQTVIDGSETIPYHPLDVIWNEDDNTITLIIPAHESLNTPQEIYYRLTYKDQEPQLSTLLTIPGDPQGTLLRNGSFELGSDGTGNGAVWDAWPWRYFYEWVGAMSRSSEQARTGSYSLKATGITGLAYPNQPITFTEPGKYEFSAYMYAEAGVGGGTVTLWANLGGVDGELNTAGEVVAASSSNGEWKKLSMELNVPQSIVGDVIYVGLELRGFAADKSVYIDDVKLVPNDTEGAVEEPEGQEQATTPQLADWGTQIYIGKQGLSASEQQLLQGMDPDGFVIHPNASRITIAGPSAWGTEFGVDEFLERYVGVRWLMPGADWEDVPAHTSLTVALENTIREEPAFFARSYEFTGYATRTRWMRDMRLHYKIKFEHNLFNLLPPSKYLETNPEFYPEGAELSLDYTWQPCFKAEGIVDESIKVINAYFDEHPEATSYSVGINDTTHFCENDYKDNVTYNSLGMVDMSNIYFKWLKDVSEGVFAKHPDKFLGTYAYFNTYDPPTNVKLDPRVYVFITDDRMSWGDPDMKQRGHELSEAWANTGASVGFYDYLYGSPYVVPRNAYQLMEDQYRYAKSIGVRAYYSELYPNFGEGPKPYLSAKLQWNPNLDKDDILQDWYERAVGTAAAVDLKAYYAIWQRFWEVDIFESDWFLSWKNSTSRTNFMPLLSPAYVANIKEEDLVESRRLLESVISKTVTPAQKKRAEDLLHMFEFYEISKASYVDQAVEVADPTTETEAHALLNRAAKKVELKIQRYAMFDAFKSSEIYLQLGTEPLSWEPVSNNEISALARWLSQHPESEIHGELEQWMQSQENEFVKLANKILIALNGAGVKNPSFADGLTYWFTYPDTIYELVDVDNEGAKAVKVKGSSVEQNVFVESGKKYVLSFDAKVDGNAGTNNLVGMNFWDVPGVGLAGARITVQPTTYKRHKIVFTPPAGFSHATIVIYKDASEGWVYATNFELKEWSEADDAKLTGVSGTNGSIVAALDGLPQITPEAQDFVVQPIINGITANPIPVSQAILNEDTFNVTLSVPAISAAAVEQQVVYKVTYKDGSEKNSPVIVIPADPTASLLLNSSFEIGYPFKDEDDIDDAKPWRYFYSWPGLITRSNEQARTGNNSMKAVGINDVAYPNQIIKFAEPGQYEFSAYIYVPSGGTASGTVTLWANLGGVDGELNTAGEVVAASSSNGEWKKLSMELNVPEAIVGNEIMVGIELKGFGANEVLYIDDIELVKL